MFNCLYPYFFRFSIIYLYTSFFFATQYHPEFKTRPTKAEVENKLFDLIRDGFVLKTKEEHEREKRLVAKGRKSLPKF